MNGLTDYQRRIIRYSMIVVGVISVYVTLVYTYFQFESFDSSQPNVGLADAIWYVFLNPTGLGDAGSFKFFPATFQGKVIGILFALTGLSLIGLFVGKVSDMFNEYREHQRLGYYGTKFKNHVLVIGWDEFSRRTVQELVLSKIRVVVVTNDKEQVDEIHQEFDDDEVFVLYADYENYGKLRLANIDTVREVFINRPSDTDTLITLLNFHNHFDDLDLHYVVRVNNSELQPTFDVEGMHVEPVTTFKVASALIASHIFEPDVATFGKDLIASAVDRDDYEIQQYRITKKNPWAGFSYGELYWDLYEDHQVIPLGIGRRQNGERKLLKLPDDDVILQVDDHVVMIVTGESAQAIRNVFGVREGLEQG